MLDRSDLLFHLLSVGRLQDESAAINSEIIGLLFALTQTTLSQACYYFMRLAGFGSPMSEDVLDARFDTHARPQCGSG